MAKIAGRKNNAAWQAANNWMQRVGEGEIADLISNLTGNDELNALLALITSTYTAFNVFIPEVLGDIGTWVDSWTLYGVPLDVWIGKASYDVYNKIDGKYKPTFAKVVADAGNSVRLLYKIAQFGSRQLGWFSRDDNIGPHPMAMRAAANRQERLVILQARLVRAHAILDARSPRPAVSIPKRQPGRKVPEGKRRLTT